MLISQSVKLTKSKSTAHFSLESGAQLRKEDLIIPTRMKMFGGIGRSGKVMVKANEINFVKDIKDEISESETRILNNLKEKFEEQAKFIETSIDDANSKLRDDFKKAISDLGNELSNSISEMKSDLADSISKTNDSVNGLKAEVHDSIGRTNELLEQLLKKF